MAIRTPIELSDGRTHRAVQAELVEGIRIGDAIDADRSWRKAMDDLLDTAHELGVPFDLYPEHTHWSWEVKTRSPGLASEFFGIQFEGEWQALMEITCGRQAVIDENPHATLVYVDYISTAPWNEIRFLALMGLQARFRGCGIGLMSAAVKRSFNLRYNGRIGLHSLSGAASFYRDKCGMADLGIDSNYENLRYFEMSGIRASDFARRYKL